MTLPCPKCGSRDTNGTFCDACLRELHPLVRSVKPVRATCCAVSRRILVGGTWKPAEDALGRLIGPALVHDGEIADVTIGVPEFVWKPGIKRTATASTVVRGKSHDAERDREESYDVPVKYEMTISPEHRKQSASYYEGILQVRNEHNAARAAIAKYLKGHRAAVTKTAELPNGTDYYLNDHRAVGHLARTLHKEFGGTLKVNAQHFSQNRQSGKTIYRTNALVGLPEFSKGDVVLQGERYLLITGIGPRIQAKDLLTGERRTFPYVPGEAHVLPVADTTVVRREPLEVLHPVTYAPVTPLNGTGAERVTVALNGDTLVIVGGKDA